MEKQRKNTRRNKGITLIALVITVIILLILAGISIAELTGTGIFAKAKEARQKYKDAEDLENQTLADYEAQLNSLGKSTVGSGDGTGNDEVDSTKTTEQLTENNLGDYVDYDVDINGDGDTTHDWRIFYVGDTDEDGKKDIFLISTNCLTNKCTALTAESGAKSKCKLVQGTTFSGMHADCNYYWESNNLPEYHCKTSGSDACSFPKLFKFEKYDIASNISNPNSLCVSSLLCTNNWSSFVISDVARCAIGGPTLEMWVDTWNAKEKDVSNFSELSVSVDKSYNYGYAQKGEYYYIKNCGSAETKDGGYDTLFFQECDRNKNMIGDVDKDGEEEFCSGYLLSSPADYRTWGTIKDENEAKRYIFDCSLRASLESTLTPIHMQDDYSVLSYFGLRPLVCLKSGVQFIKQSGSDGNEDYYKLKNE